MSTDEKSPTLFSIDAVLKQVEEKSFCYYVWPYEGAFDANGKWKFHKGTYREKPDGQELEYPTKPLMVDLYSASAVSVIYKAINEDHKAKLRQRSDEHRGLFAGWTVPTCFQLIEKHKA